ncbi:MULTISPECIES: hypothetical protein [Enterococcus]|uniref:hypothetical protein n=1 Tax=Enterococcus TaxID=1350 RepID=UPI000CF0336B|nr:hypothetical protein [Enterococcus faecium]EGP4846806.1 hypothetical protein [Enterococcus faecium]EGP4892490.1 hypothetical protein [Enterococcus faecium]EGP4915218.1 hypothetical protein [Enterococcus faecium]EGP4917854.1 hypothetical protein [Enterococcus faecium]EME3574940.1 hypothetical protein [Enterococcus faecium]
MITMFTGIGKYPGNRIIIKNEVEQILGFSVVSYDCTYEINLAHFLPDSLLYIMEFDANNHLIHSSCINIKINKF